MPFTNPLTRRKPPAVKLRLLSWVSSPSLFTPTGDGNNFQFQGPGLLVVLAALAYRQSKEKITPESRARSRVWLEEFLAAAHAGGYPQTELLHTLLVKHVQGNGKPSRRIDEMTDAAYTATDKERINAIFAAMGGTAKAA